MKNLGDLIKYLPDIVEIKGDVNKNINNIIYDSRQIGSGDLFVAIKGYQTDGHKFIKDAIQKGAVAIICEEKIDAELVSASGISRVQVKNSRRALAILGDKFYDSPSKKLRLVGITGTNGKTTTSFLIKSIFENAGYKSGLIGTIDYIIGDKKIPAERTTPESLELHKFFNELIESKCQSCVMEVSSHSLALDRVYGIDFEVAVFTNITRDHLDFHKTFEEYLNAKSLLFENLSKNAKAVINLDDPSSDYIVKKCKSEVLTYSIENSSANLYCKKFEYGLDGTEMEVEFKWKMENGSLPLSEAKGWKEKIDNVKIFSYLIGRFNVYNILSAVATGIALGFDKKDIVKGIENVKSISGRFERVEAGQKFKIIVDYAHTPDALKNILLAVNDLRSRKGKGRIICLFGCGGDRDRGKRPIMGKIAKDMSDIVVVTSDNPRTENPEKIIDEIFGNELKVEIGKIERITDRGQAIKRAIEIANDDDIVVLVGKGHEDYQIIGNQKFHFDDREEVRKAVGRS